MKRFLPFVIVIVVIIATAYYALTRIPASPPQPASTESPSEKVLLPVLVEFTIELAPPALAPGPTQVVPGPKIEIFVERLKASGWKEERLDRFRFRYTRPIGTDTRGFHNPARIGRPEVAAGK